MDERAGKPSASSLYRLAACPKSGAMCAGLPDTSSADSDFGNSVHDLWAGRVKPEDCTPEAVDRFEEFQKIEADVLAQWKLRLHIPDNAVVTCHRDNKRLWLTIDGEQVFSGLADVIYLWGKHALILDGKTLPGEHGDGTDNLQLRSLAVLVESNYEWLTSCEVCLIQPLVTHSPTVCRYGSDELLLARKELLHILNEAQKPDAPLNAGDHCGYCRARAICPAVHQQVKNLSMMTLRGEEGLTITDEEMAALRERTGAAKKMIAAIESESFRRAEANPEKWRAMGFEIKEGAGRRSIEDIGTVSERLNAMGVPWRDITKACTMPLGKLEALARQATNAKGMQLKKECDAILDGCVAIKAAKATLKRIGTNLEDSDE